MNDEDSKDASPWIGLAMVILLIIVVNQGQGALIDRFKDNEKRISTLEKLIKAPDLKMPEESK